MSVYLILLSLVLALLIYQHFRWKAEPWPENAVKPPPYQGHRGYWKGGEQENTLASFAAAGARGLQMVEMDVRLAKGNVPVIFHDDHFNRLGRHRPEFKNRRVPDLTADQLKEWQDAPSLEEVLALKGLPPYFNIEIKSSSVFDGRLEKEVARLVKKYNAEKRVMFSSFNPFTVWRLSRLLPQVPRALLASRAKDPENNFVLRRMLLAPYVNVNALHLDQNFISPADIERFKTRGIPVAIWTVNSAPMAEEYLRAGALSVITDTLGSAGEPEPSPSENLDS